MQLGAIGDLTSYTKAFSSTLDKDIKFMCTGQVVVSGAFPLENVEFMQQACGNQIAV